MPAVRVARSKFAKMQREVASHEKSIRSLMLELAVAATRKERALAKAGIKAAAALLKTARSSLKNVAAELRRILAIEAAKSRAMAQERSLAIYKLKLQSKLGKDLEKAMARFASVWKKKRNKIVSRKLSARMKREAVKARAASRKANAKAKESLQRAEAIAKARASKAAVKAKIKARKLAVKAKAKLVVRKARKTPLTAVKARKVSRKTRSK
jgi:histone H1/5